VSDVTPGTLYGVGLGPGDPELVTVKAARLIGAADVIAYHCARHGRSVARSIAEPYLRGDQAEEQLVYPVTTEATDHPGGYEGAMEEFYASAAARLMAHLEAGRDVVLLAEGDPLFYSSYMHMHKRISARYRTQIVPGVTSVSAACAALAMPLAEGDDVLTVLPGTLGREGLTRRLRDPGAAAIMKIGRSYAAVREALKDSGRLADAYYVERASGGTRQVIERAGDVDPASVPYMSLLILSGPEASARPQARAAATGGDAPSAVPQPAASGQPAGDVRGDDAGEGHTVTGAWRAAAAGGGAPSAVPQSAGSGEAAEGVRGDDAGEGRRVTGAGRVDVVGLGPAGRDWLTPQAAAVLAAADDIVGYQPYVARVPVNPRQRRHGSDNRVEAQRAEFALDLALRGRRVAVVSSGDPGVFAMASPVLEAAACDERFAGVPVGIVPGITAAQAVASLAGAPLGHDYVMLSLSDRLKPWHVIARRLAAAADGDFAIAIYNPASASRRRQLADAVQVLLTRRSAGTPAVIGRAVGSPEQQVTVTTLGELDPAQVDMRCLLIIGSSQSRVIRGAAGQALVITPRRYPG
jgi:precorrin-2 C20-methyltransferase / precorrin-3B C17-methyltransferase